MWYFFLVCGERMRCLNKSLGYKYEMLVTFHSIWYVFTELCTPAWQKDLRDITYFIFEAMDEAKKKPVAKNKHCVKIKYSSHLCKHGLNLHTAAGNFT